MKTINVALKTNPYKIEIINSLKKLGPSLKKLNVGKDAIIITNPIIIKHFGKDLIRGLKKNDFSVKVFDVPSGERSKSSSSAFKLLEQIARYDVLKKVFIIAFGGGVIGDLAGFIAAVYKRGIPYVQIPTTFLAQIDSAIGGKVAIDLPIGKNLVGAFYQPKLVWTDVNTLSTLDYKQMRNGLAEAIKYGIIYDKKLFNYIVKNHKQLVERKTEQLKIVVTRCSQIKAKIIVEDEKETKGIRTILNFGHTLGHAIEAAGKYKAYNHGEAVALGMRVASEISYAAGMLSLKELININKAISTLGLPKRIKKYNINDLIKIMNHDKKFIYGGNRFVLVRKIGKVCVREGVSLKIIKDSIKKYF